MKEVHNSRDVSFWQKMSLPESPGTRPNVNAIKSMDFQVLVHKIYRIPVTMRQKTDSGIVMVDGTFFGDSFEQDWSWDDSGTTISGI